VRPDSRVRAEYIEAFREIATRITDTLSNVRPADLPIKMYVAGGAALHFYTGERVSRDIDAMFSRRIALPEDLEVAYRDADGAARLLYFDRQYNDSLSLMHEDAQEDSICLALEGIDARRLDVRLLTPLDLAVSKLSRFAEQDRNDIVSLARHQRVHSTELRARALQALAGYVGSTERVRGSIELACRILEDHERGTLENHQG
jgi:hypothetical protein